MNSQPGPSVKDYLAVTALVLAVVTLVLDFTFFVLSSLALQRSEREQARVFTEMREVLAHIEERAQLAGSDRRAARSPRRQYAEDRRRDR
ncbi:MAG: hypothetical protein JO057_30555 [Chloroflexi bacterium]|nr:hypothetical protein [Chloroflexota bacterium]